MPSPSAPSSFLHLGPAFQAERLAPIRTALARYATAVAPGVLHAIGAYGPATPPADCAPDDAVVILALHAVYVCGPHAPFHRLLAHVEDAEAPAVYAACRAACADGALPFCHPAGALAVIAPLLADRTRTSVTAVNLLTGAVQPVRVAPHPRATDPTAPPPGGLDPFRNPPPHPVNAQYRSGSIPVPTDLDDPSAGVVRRQETFRTPTGRLITLSEVARRRADDPQACGGLSDRRDRAAAVSRCEAVERFLVFQRPTGTPVEVASYAALCRRHGADAVVDPASLHYMPLADPAFTDYAPEVPLAWTPVWDWCDGRSVLCPADEVWFDARADEPARTVVQRTTSGAAVGGSVLEAVLFGALEALERDAYMTAWALHRPCPKLDPDAVSLPAFHRLRDRLRLLDPAVHVQFFDAMNDCGIPVVWGIAFRTSGAPARLHASAAHFNVEQAMLSVLEDLDMFLNAAPDPDRAAHLEANPGAIATADDHRLYHGTDAALRHLSCVPLNAPPTRTPDDVHRAAWRPPSQATDLTELLPALARHLAGCDVRLLSADLSLPGLCARGLYAGRAILPGAVPTAYGASRIRIRCTPRLHRLWRAHHDDALAPERLQTVPHPFS